MALDIQINGVTKNAFTRYRTLRIEKHGAMETCRVEFLDHDTSALAFRPIPGDALHVYRDTVHLEYGGEVTRVTDRRLDDGDGGGTVTIVESRGWYFEAADIRIPVLVLPAQTLQENVEYIRTRYLAAKGWVNLEASPGGPMMPMLAYVNQTIQQIFDDFTKKKGYPWRVNGDREMAFTAPGSLVAPYTYDNTNSIVLRGATWSQERVRRATRLFITTGGTGQMVAHHEDHVADGTKTSFPVNVLPPEIAGAVNNAAGYAAAATSMAIDGLPKSVTIPAGSTFRFGGHAGYVLSADATTDVNGAATISFAGGLAQAVVDDEALVFGADTFVTLEVGGTPTALDGAPWGFDPEQALFVTSGAAPAASTVITYRTVINFPAEVRVWDASAQNADGTFNYGAARDAEVHWPEIADVAQAKTQGDTEIAYRTAEPKELRLATFAQDVYPWMSAPCSFPERHITGNYLVQSVILTDVGKRNQDPRVELVLLEGSSIGRDWRGYWMGKDGGAVFVPVAAVHQVAIEVVVEAPRFVDVHQAPTEILVRPNADIVVHQGTREVLMEN